MYVKEALATVEEVVSAHYAGITPDDVGEALEALNALAKLAPGDDGTRFVGEFTAAQIKGAARFIDFPLADERVRIYALADGSIDVHQSDAVDNIDPDGKRNG